ncbi:MAG TPA: tetratricopeptide repeat protein [Candidatus Omnitrophota bacterium]|nr:tetratricopeptide repeat protein [Candidatus Omnitrophota bacterium]
MILVRKSRFFLQVAVLWVLVCPGVASAQSPSRFEEANTCYRTGDFEKSAELFEALVRDEPGHPVFLYNLGNAYVRTGKLSQAILAFEKALLASPRNTDVRQNLEYARSLLEYRVDDDRNWYLKVTEVALSYFTQLEANFLALVFLALFLLVGSFYFIFKQPVFWGMGRKILVVFVIATGALAGLKHVQVDMIRPAIIMANECNVRYGPSEHDQIAFKMGEGLKVFIMDRRADWSRVLLTNGENGWVHHEDISEITLT